MWLIFVLAVGLSFITMIVRSVQSSWSFEGIVYNAADVLMVSSILCSLMKRAGGKIILESYELFYILGVFGICIFWVSSGGTYNTNILSQILISLGYAPTIHKMKEKKRNTESFLIWILLFFNALASIYPAALSGKLESFIYSLRATIMTFLFLVFMVIYENKSKKIARSPSSN